MFDLKNLTVADAAELLVETVKTASFREKAADAPWYQSLLDGAKGVGNQIANSDLVKNVSNLNVQDPAAAAVIGGGLGLGTGALATALSPDKRKRWLRNMAMGGLAGAGIGGGAAALAQGMGAAQAPTAGQAGQGELWPDLNSLQSTMKLMNTPRETADGVATAAPPVTTLGVMNGMANANAANPYTTVAGGIAGYAGTNAAQQAIINRRANAPATLSEIQQFPLEIKDGQGLRDIVDPEIAEAVVRSNVSPGGLKLNTRNVEIPLIKNSPAMQQRGVKPTNVHIPVPVGVSRVPAKFVDPYTAAEIKIPPQVMQRLGAAAKARRAPTTARPSRLLNVVSGIGVPIGLNWGLGGSSNNQPVTSPADVPQ